MKIAPVANVVSLFFGLVLAVPPRNSEVIRKRQASSSTCSCPSDVFVTATVVSTFTVTSSATVSTNAGGTQVTVATSTTVTTVSRTTTVSANNVASTTLTVADRTSTTSAAATTVTVFTTISSTTVTTCIPTAYKMKRQASGGSGSITVTGSAPQTTTLTMNLGASSSPPATCVCTLVSAYPFPSSTSTSPATSACNCRPVLSYTTTTSATVTTTSVVISTIESYATSTITPSAISTQYNDVTITTTSTTTFTVRSASLTTTLRSTITTTSTVTPTHINCPTADTSCNNSGIRWGIYKNTNANGQNNTNNDKTYSSFDPTVFKKRTPMYQNVTYTLGGFDYPAAQPVYVSFYGSPQKFESDYIAINHVGYIFAQVTGTYTFSISKSDDITMFWIGSNAYSGWTRANANIVNAYGEGTSTYRIDFVENTYYPLRIVFGNAQEALVFEATVTSPDGTVILTSNSKKNPYLVQFSCDGRAPAFAAFGNET